MKGTETTAMSAGRRADRIVDDHRGCEFGRERQLGDPEAVLRGGPWMDIYFAPLDGTIIVVRSSTRLAERFVKWSRHTLSDGTIIHCWRDVFSGRLCPRQEAARWRRPTADERAKLA